MMGLFDWLFGSKSLEDASRSSDAISWAISENGNPTAVRHGKRITVFPEYGGWKFCIARASVDDDNPHFSGRYETLEAAKYEALAWVEGRPLLHKTTYEQRQERNHQASREYVASRRIVLDEIKMALVSKPDTVTALRKIENKLTSSLKALPRMRDDIYISGADDEVAAIDRLIADFEAHGRIIEEIIVELKARPRKARPST